MPNPLVPPTSIRSGLEPSLPPTLASISTNHQPTPTISTCHQPSRSTFQLRTRAAQTLGHRGRGAQVLARRPLTGHQPSRPSAPTTNPHQPSATATNPHDQTKLTRTHARTHAHTHSDCVPVATNPHDKTKSTNLEVGFTLTETPKKRPLSICSNDLYRGVIIPIFENQSVGRIVRADVCGWRWCVWVQWMVMAGVLVLDDQVDREGCEPQG